MGNAIRVQVAITPRRCSHGTREAGGGKPALPDARLRSFFFIPTAMPNSGNLNQREDVDNGSSQKGGLRGRRMTGQRAKTSLSSVSVINTV